MRRSAAARLRVAHVERVRRRKRLGQLRRVALAVVAVAVVGWSVHDVRGTLSGSGPKLPELMEPARFAGILDVAATERIGTLLVIDLSVAPDPRHRADFELRVGSAGSLAAGEGYDSILVKAPDGAVLAHGAASEPTVDGLGTTGT